MRALEDALVELHELEEQACGRRGRGFFPISIEHLRSKYLVAKEQVTRLDLRGDDRARASALVETVGMLLAMRETCGDTSIAARVLN